MPPRYFQPCIVCSWQTSDVARTTAGVKWQTASRVAPENRTVTVPRGESLYMKTRHFPAVAFAAGLAGALAVHSVCPAAGLHFGASGNAVPNTEAKPPPPPPPPPPRRHLVRPNPQDQNHRNHQRLPSRQIHLTLPRRNPPRPSRRNRLSHPQCWSAHDRRRWPKGAGNKKPPRFSGAALVIRADFAGAVTSSSRRAFPRSRPGRRRGGRRARETASNSRSSGPLCGRTSRCPDRRRVHRRCRA